MKTTGAKASAKSTRVWTDPVTARRDNGHKAFLGVELASRLRSSLEAVPLQDEAQEFADLELAEDSLDGTVQMARWFWSLTTTQQLMIEEALGRLRRELGGVAPPAPGSRPDLSVDDRI